MEAAADACRQGNLKVVESLPDSELQRLLSKTDEDGRWDCLLRPATSFAACREQLPHFMTRHETFHSPHRTLLHAAASGGNKELFQFLISKGAGSSVNTADEEVQSHAHHHMFCSKYRC